MKKEFPKISFWQIFNTNVGFFGIQYSFGLQQTAVNPIYSFWEHMQNNFLYLI